MEYAETWVQLAERQEAQSEDLAEDEEQEKVQASDLVEDDEQEKVHSEDLDEDEEKGVAQDLGAVVVSSESEEPKGARASLKDEEHKLSLLPCHKRRGDAADLGVEEEEEA